MHLIEDQRICCGDKQPGLPEDLSGKVCRAFITFSGEICIGAKCKFPLGLHAVQLSASAGICLSCRAFSVSAVIGASFLSEQRICMDSLKFLNSSSLAINETNLLS